MSVQRNNYVFLGIKFDYQRFEELFGEDGDLTDRVYDFGDDTFDPHPKSHNGLTIIIDGMCGKYCFVGKILAKTPAESDDGFDGIVRLDDDLEKQKHEVFESIKKNNFQAEECRLDNIFLYAFTHVT